MAEAPFAGAVLTGGRSSRMGRDKALLRIDGTPLAMRVAAALRTAGADPVMAIGGDLAGLAAAGFHGVADPQQGSGPLAGIATALREIPGAHPIVILACDLTGANPAAIRAVVESLYADPAALVAVPVADGRLEPLHAAWRRAALPHVERALAAGDLAVRSVLDGVPVVRVIGLDPAAFRNVNFPADLGQTEAMTDAPLPEIDVEELARRHAEGSFVLDVRQPDEYQAGHVPGAVLVPLGELGGRTHELPGDRPLLVICKSGGRSATAVEALSQAGFDATNVAGGTMAWIEAGHPVVEGAEPG